MDFKDLPPNLVIVTPTKALFVEMLTRDIHLDRAVNDLVDNSVDGARRMRPGDNESLTGLYVHLFLSEKEFRIEDNCGGIPLKLAREHAFRFGRPKGAPPTPNSVGQFGVGMKRALFKFGRYFEVTSTTPEDHFTLKVNVDEWEDEETPWTFPISPYAEKSEPAEAGTKILVNRLRDDAKNNFGQQSFINNLLRTVEQAQQQWLQGGLEIKVNGERLTALPWTIYNGGGISPAVWQQIVTPQDIAPITIRICAGVGDSSPKDAGWYVSCNGRMILSADQTETTGWNLSYDDKTAPKYHNQFARFRGYVFFESENAAQLPWNTTKDDIDVDSAVYQFARQYMVQLMRPVIDFLNAVDAEDPDAGVGTPLRDALRSAPSVRVRELRTPSTFLAPTATTGPKMSTISFAREKARVLELREALNLATNREVGIKAFEDAYATYVEDET